MTPEHVIADALVAEYDGEPDNVSIVVLAHHIAEVTLKALADAGYELAGPGEDAADVAASDAALADPEPAVPLEQVKAELGLT